MQGRIRSSGINSNGISCSLAIDAKRSATGISRNRASFMTSSLLRFSGTVAGTLSPIKVTIRGRFRIGSATRASSTLSGTPSFRPPGSRISGAERGFATFCELLLLCSRRAYGIDPVCADNLRSDPAVAHSEGET